MNERGPAVNQLFHQIMPLSFPSGLTLQEGVGVRFAVPVVRLGYSFVHTLCIKWYQFVRKDDVRRLTKQPKLTAIIQSRRLTLFRHIMHMDDNKYAKRILLAFPLVDWRRQPGRPHITWLSTVQQDLKQYHLTLPEVADLAQNRPLWRMMSTYGAMQS